MTNMEKWIEEVAKMNEKNPYKRYMETVNINGTIYTREKQIKKEIKNKEELKKEVLNDVCHEFVARVELYPNKITMTSKMNGRFITYLYDFYTSELWLNDLKKEIEEYKPVRFFKENLHPYAKPMPLFRG